jgi:hypothetical protein
MNPSQQQLYWNASKSTSQFIMDAAWLCGLLGDNPNPLNIEEIKNTAASGKPYAWVFKSIAEAYEKFQHGDNLDTGHVFDKLIDVLGFARNKVAPTGISLAKASLQELQDLRKSRAWIIGVRGMAMVNRASVPADREFSNMKMFCDFVRNPGSNYWIAQYYCYQLR